MTDRVVQPQEQPALQDLREGQPVDTELDQDNNNRRQDRARGRPDHLTVKVKIPVHRYTQHDTVNEVSIRNLTFAPANFPVDKQFASVHIMKHSTVLYSSGSLPVGEFDNTEFERLIRPRITPLNPQPMMNDIDKSTAWSHWVSADVRLFFVNTDVADVTWAEVRDELMDKLDSVSPHPRVRPQGQQQRVDDLADVLINQPLRARYDTLERGMNTANERAGLRRRTRVNKDIILSTYNRIAPFINVNDAALVAMRAAEQ